MTKYGGRNATGRWRKVEEGCDGEGKKGGQQVKGCDGKGETGGQLVGLRKDRVGKEGDKPLQPPWAPQISSKVSAAHFTARAASALRHPRFNTRAPP